MFLGLDSAAVSRIASIAKKPDLFDLAYRSLERDFLNGDDEAGDKLGKLLNNELSEDDLLTAVQREKDFMSVR